MLRKTSGARASGRLSMTGRRAAALVVAVGSVAMAMPLSAAGAAQVDLVVTLNADRAVYSAEATAQYDVQVDNRGQDATSGPSTLKLVVPNTSGSTVSWETTVTCTAAGGAVCPTSYTRANTAVSAVIPTIPVAGHLDFSFKAPGNPYNRFVGKQQVQATVAATSDTDGVASTNTAIATVNIVAADVRYGEVINAPQNAAGGDTITIDYVIRNDSNIADSLYSRITTTDGAGSGAAANFFVQYSVVDVQCVAPTGGADCSTIYAAQDYSNSRLQPQPSPLLTSRG